MPAAQAVIHDRKQAVGVGRKIDPDDAGFLVDDVIEETGILMREAVVVLLPDMRGEQVTLEPPLALVLAEHRVQYAPGRGEELVARHRPGVPLAAGFLEDRTQEIRERLVGAEDPEIAAAGVELDHVTQELAQNEGVLRVNGTGGRHRDRMGTEVRHVQVAQQDPAVGVRIGAHPPVTQGCQLSQVRQEAAVGVEQFLGLVAPHPALQLAQVSRMASVDQERYLVRPEGAFDLQAVNDLRAGPALG
jgi:hypothetical protein